MPARPPSWAEEVAARLRASTAKRRKARWIVAAATLTVVIVAAGTVVLSLARQRPAAHPPAPTHRISAPAAAGDPATSADTPVTLAEAAATSPYQAGVLAFLSQYFSAINRHNLAAYQRLFGPSLQHLSTTGFGSGYGTTTDSGVTLRSIAVLGAGEVVAHVSFTSHQQPTASPTNSACTSWNVSLYLLQKHGSYLLQPPPTGYRASYTSCS